jgi:hypothetical protein
VKELIMSILWKSMLLSAVFVTVACANSDDYVMREPNYDHLVGKEFGQSIYMGRKVYKVISSTAMLEELENRRGDGCILVFGVRKQDDVILFWRIDSGAGTCRVRNKAISR